jgi:hypothetical protein
VQRHSFYLLFDNFLNFLKDMKTLIGNTKLKLTLLFITLFNTFCLFGQEAGGTQQQSTSVVEKSSSSSATIPANWYAAPWVWIVAAAVFILLLVALMRNGGGTTRVESTTRTD